MDTTTLRTTETPEIRYRGGGGAPTVVGEGRADAAPDERPAVIRWLNWAVFGVLVAVWAVVGAVVWIPLLIRTMVRLAFALVPATLDGGHPTEAAEDLRGAVDFYRRGFVVAADAVHGRTDATPRKARSVRRRGLLGEFVWAALIWYALLALLGWVWSPVEIARWTLALPWGDWMVGALATILEPFS